MWVQFKNINQQAAQTSGINLNNYYKMKNQNGQITGRLDNLPFSSWHLILIIGIGTIWFFDGYEVSLTVQLSHYILDIYTQNQYKALATIYQVGCIIGSVSFGFFSYYKGRRFVFLITLGIYVVGIIMCIIPGFYPIFLLGRLLTGISVGGEFTAVFTAIDQFLPPSIRGRADIIIDSSWHLGGALASILNLIFGQVQFWRGFYIVGGIGSIGLICIRKNLPESPRWLISNGRYSQANTIIQNIEFRVLQGKGIPSSDNLGYLQNSDRQREQEIISSNASAFEDQEINQNQLLKDQFLHIVSHYKMRLFLSCFLIFSQAFFINHFLFSFPIILAERFNLSQSEIALYLLPLYLTAFFITFLIGPLFDIFGRRIMLLITYCCSGILYILASLTDADATQLQVFYVFMFMFASPASSSANLIASEIFPTRSRSIVLSFIFILSMLGGMCGVWVDKWWAASVLMILSGIAGGLFCPKGENKSLQAINQMVKQYDKHN